MNNNEIEELETYLFFITRAYVGSLVSLPCHLILITDYLFYSPIRNLTVSILRSGTRYSQRQISRKHSKYYRTRTKPAAQTI
ncbi:hypothetical protein PUN28_009595 [Cardiocondyla obscurior]|uniref:Uncharacterized protein n=1 Tax=Cardiocondyla obscurior TaxID=286306 RepID=A0AAW2FUE8_9HYME